MTKSPWKTLKSDIIYENKWIRIIEDKIIHPDGREGIYAYMDAIPGIIVIAKDTEGIYLLKEYKYPLKKYIWNLVTGGLGREEDPLKRAKAELFEEMGITAEKWTELGQFYSTPAVESTDNYVFLAETLTIDRNHRLGEGDEAIQQIKKFSISEVKEMIKHGNIESGLVLGALMQYFLFLGEE